jgi:hypothetical protein
MLMVKRCLRAQTSSTSCIGSRILVSTRLLKIEGQTLTLKRAMECKAATANHNIAYESNQEDGIVTILEAISNSLNAKGYEQEVGERVDNLCAVNGSIVVL